MVCDSLKLPRMNVITLTYLTLLNLNTLMKAWSQSHSEAPLFLTAAKREMFTLVYLLISFCIAIRSWLQHRVLWSGTCFLLVTLDGVFLGVTWEALLYFWPIQEMGTICCESSLKDASQRDASVWLCYRRTRVYRCVIVFFGYRCLCCLHYNIQATACCIDINIYAA